MSARVIPRRTASACPATPPPHTLASTLKVAAVSVETSGHLALDALRRRHKVLIERLAVDLEFAAAGTKKNTRDRRLAAACSVVLN